MTWAYHYQRYDTSCASDAQKLSSSTVDFTHLPKCRVLSPIWYGGDTTAPISLPRFSGAIDPETSYVNVLIESFSRVVMAVCFGLPARRQHLPAKLTGIVFRLSCLEFTRRFLPPLPNNNR